MQLIAWEIRLRNDLSCVEWDVKPNLPILVPTRAQQVCIAECDQLVSCLFSFCQVWTGLVIRRRGPASACSPGTTALHALHGICTWLPVGLVISL